MTTASAAPTVSIGLGQPGVASSFGIADGNLRSEKVPLFIYIFFFNLPLPLLSEERARYRVRYTRDPLRITSPQVPAPLRQKYIQCRCSSRVDGLGDSAPLPPPFLSLLSFSPLSRRESDCRWGPRGGETVEARDPARTFCFQSARGHPCGAAHPNGSLAPLASLHFVTYRE